MAKLYFKQSKQKKIMRSLSQDPVLWNLVKIVCACASFRWGKIYQVLHGVNHIKRTQTIPKGPRAAALLKKRFWHRRFPVNFGKFLTTPFLQNTPRSLLLNLQILYFKLCRSKHAKIKPDFYTVYLK